MSSLFVKKEERTFTTSVARARFLWLLVASLLLPVAASLSGNAEHSERFESQLSAVDENR